MTTSETYSKSFGLGYQTYKEIVESILDTDIEVKLKDFKRVLGRDIVIHQLREESVPNCLICAKFGMNHATVIFAEKRIKDLLQFHNGRDYEFQVYEKFITECYRRKRQMEKFKSVHIGDIVTVCCKSGDCSICKGKFASKPYMVTGKEAKSSELNNGVVKLESRWIKGRDLVVNANEICTIYEAKKD